VSRGPVREAIRALEKRGLVEIFPRRGAFVVDITLDAIADLFNMRAVLLGLAARCLAARGEGADKTIAHATTLRTLAARDDTDPVSFALATGRTGGAMYRRCANAQLIRALDHQNQGSLWGLIWRERPLDFVTAERRRQTARDWTDAGLAIRSGDGVAAERIVRKALFDSRDGALETLRKVRGGSLDGTKIFRD